MDENQIKCFLALCESLSFTKAANRLHKSQSVLTRQIQSMEARLGFDLFVRDSQSCKLTEAGKYMYAELSKLSNQYTKIVETAARRGKGLTGILRIGVAGGESSLQYAPLLRAFTDVYPNVEIKINAVPIRSFRSALEDFSLDIVVSVYYLPWTATLCRTGFRYLHTGKRHDCLYVPAYHPLANTDPKQLTMLDFRNDVFLVLSDFEVDINNGPTTKQCMIHGIRPTIRPCASINDLLAALELGQGIHIGSNRLWIYGRQAIQSLYLPELGSIDEIMIWNEENANPCLINFVQFLKHFMQEQPDFSQKDIYYV